MPASEKESWLFRQPPRGQTADEYKMCYKYDTEESCHMGPNCTEAHSPDELQEWIRRFELHRLQMRKVHDADRDNNLFASSIMEQWMNASDKSNVMVDVLEGVNLHLNYNSSVPLTSKHSSHTWLFTLTSKLMLRRIALLEDDTRANFSIAAVTTGPKRSQKGQTIDENGQGWTNPAWTSELSKSSTDQVFRIKVHFRTDIYGAFQQCVLLDFGSKPILRHKLSVDSSPVVDFDQVTQELCFKEVGKWDTAGKELVKFASMNSKNDFKESSLLTEYPAPAQIITNTSLKDANFTLQNYRERMHTLLYIEEMAKAASVAKFNVKTKLQVVDRFMLMPTNLSNARFAINGELFAKLQLTSHISEDTSRGRLILQNVFKVLISPLSTEAKRATKMYEAIVEEKGKNFIFMKISKQCVDELELKADEEFECEILFQMNRLPLCEMHKAVDSFRNIEILFPDPKDNEEPGSLSKCREPLTGMDPRLNKRQIEAVTGIANASLDHPTPPVLIIGPYGTGKTFTLSQAAMEIVKRENTRVLICTHSNSAADLYIKEYLNPFVMANPVDHAYATPLRIYYQHRWVQTVSDCILPYSLVVIDVNGQKSFRRPQCAELVSKRIIITTLGTAHYLYDMNLPSGFFTHILIDEAAQAMEAEIIIPLALAGPNTTVVLAGDHMQLSPEVHSELSRNYNLHHSLLERLCDVYLNGHPSKLLLCDNYRSHQAIVDFTSELFYDNRLVATGNQPGHPTLFPLTFYTARGEDIQHANCTAYYNNSEIYELADRVVELRSSWPPAWGELKDSDIGVVAPYSDQVTHIRAELRRRRLHGVSVERVLNVQGKQFRAIFISTVRTRHTCTSDSSMDDFVDYRFLSDEKLLNTAITRAKSLVAVVGDPVALCSVGKCRKLWERFIEIADQNNSLFGMTWENLRTNLDGVELKRTYILNPHAAIFVPTLPIALNPDEEAVKVFLEKPSATWETDLGNGEVAKPPMKKPILTNPYDNSPIVPDQKVSDASYRTTAIRNAKAQTMVYDEKRIKPVTTSAPAAAVSHAAKRTAIPPVSLALSPPRDNGHSTPPTHMVSATTAAAAAPPSSKFDYNQSDTRALIHHATTLLNSTKQFTGVQQNGASKIAPVQTPPGHWSTAYAQPPQRQDVNMFAGNPPNMPSGATASGGGGGHNWSKIPPPTSMHSSQSYMMGNNGPYEQRQQISPRGRDKISPSQNHYDRYGGGASAARSNKDDQIMHWQQYSRTKHHDLNGYPTQPRPAAYPYEGEGAGGGYPYAPHSMYDSSSMHGGMQPTMHGGQPLNGQAPPPHHQVGGANHPLVMGQHPNSLQQQQQQQQQQHPLPPHHMNHPPSQQQHASHLQNNNGLPTSSAHPHSMPLQQQQHHHQQQQHQHQQHLHRQAELQRMNQASSYSGAVRNITPEGMEAEGEFNPLDLLKNLNIKSTSEEAQNTGFYQYFL